MSDEAIKAYYRLAPLPAVYGTAWYVLYYLAWRHNTKNDAAYPSINRIVSDLKIPRQTLLDAIQRLTDVGLVRVRRAKTRGRGRTNRYSFPWLKIHLLDPQSEKAIDWETKKSGSPDHLEEGSGPPDHLEKETVWATGKNSLVDRQEIVRPTRSNNTNNINNSDPPFEVPGAGSETMTADERFAIRLAEHQPSDGMRR